MVPSRNYFTCFYYRYMEKIDFAKLCGMIVSETYLFSKTIIGAVFTNAGSVCGSIWKALINFIVFFSCYKSYVI